MLFINEKEFVLRCFKNLIFFSVIFFWTISTTLFANSNEPRTQVGLQNSDLASAFAAENYSKAPSSLSFNSNQIGLTNSPISFNATYSDTFGAYVSAGYLYLLNQWSGLDLKAEVGDKTMRANGTYGFLIGSHDELKISGEYLRQDLGFDFASGTTYQWIGQSAGGLSYQHILPNKWLNALSANVYYSRAQNKELSSEQVIQNGITYLDERNIVGATAEGLSLNATFLTSPRVRLTPSLSFDSVVYPNHYENHDDDSNKQFGGGLKWEQLITKQFKSEIDASARAYGNDILAKIDWAMPAGFGKRIEWGVSAEHFTNKVSGPDNNQISLNFSYQWDGKSTNQTIGFSDFKPTDMQDLTTWVATPAVYMPEVLAVADEEMLRLTPYSQPIPPLSIASAEFILGYDVSPYFTSPNNTSLVFTATGLPPNFIISANGLVQGRAPFTTQQLVYHAQITARNNSGYSATEPLTITVTASSDSVPTITNPGNQSGVQNSLITIPIVATGDNLIYSVSGLPDGMAIDETTGVINGMPTTVGMYTVTASVANTAAIVSTSFKLAVTSTGPTLTNPGTQTYELGESVVLPLMATGVGLTYSAVGLPASLNIDSSTGLISGTATILDPSPGTPVTVTVTDSLSRTAQQTFNIIVNDSGPTITNPGNQTLPLGAPYSLDMSNFTTGNALVYSATGLPTGLSINSSTGVIAGTPTVAANFPAQVTVTNNSGSPSTSFTFIVSTGAPALSSIPNQTTQVNVPYSFDLSTYASGNSLQYTVSDLPAGLSVNTSTGLISGTPTVTGSFPLSVTVSNSGGQANSSFTLNVVYAAPTISNPGTQSPVTVGIPYSLNMAPYATGSALTFSASGLPTGLTIDSSTGLISGIPTATIPAPVSVTVTVTNTGGSASTTFDINLVDQAPSIQSPGNLSATTASPYSFAMQPYTTGNNLIYTSTGLAAAGLTINSSTGVISGTPPSSGTYPVTITVTNSGGTATTPSFNLIVDSTTSISNPGNRSTPINSPYSLDMSAYTTGTSLTYSGTGLNVAGLNLSINPTTGVISGTPTAIGTYPVTIQVDAPGGPSTSFNIQVTQVAPTFSNPSNQTVNLGTPYTLDTATYATGADLTFSATNLPPGLSIASNGVISGTPTTVGSYTVILTATNSAGSANAQYTLTVQNPPPALATIPDQTSMVSIPFSLNTSTYATGSNLTYSATGLPAGLVINPSTGTISGTPTAVALTPVPVSVTITNSAGSASQSFNMVVNPTPPTLTNPGSFSFPVNTPITPINLASYATGTNLTYSATGLTGTGLSIDSSTGVISGTPTSPVVISVTATVTNVGGSASQTFPITFTTTPPVMASIPNQSIITGNSIQLNLSNYTTGAGITYSATNLPAGLSLNSSTGIISGAATATGTYSVTATTTNTGGIASRSFNITSAPPFVFNPIGNQNVYLYVPFNVNVSNYIVGTYTSITVTVPPPATINNIFNRANPGTGGTAIYDIPTTTFTTINNVGPAGASIGTYPATVVVANGAYQVSQTFNFNLKICKSYSTGQC